MPNAAPRAPALLSAQVSLIRLWSSPVPLPSSSSNGSAFRSAPFPPRKLFVGRLPRFFGTVKHSDFLPPFPRRFVSFTSRYRRPPRVLLPRAQGATPVGQGLLTGFPYPGSSTETTGPPRFLKNPTMNVPCSSTPAGPLRSATAALRCCLPPNWTTSAPARTVLGAQSHGPFPLAAAYASQSGLPHCRARLTSGGAGQPYRAGLATRCPKRKVSGHPILLSQASPGALILHGKGSASPTAHV